MRVCAVLMPCKCRTNAVAIAFKTSLDAHMKYNSDSQAARHLVAVMTILILSLSSPALALEGASNPVTSTTTSASTTSPTAALHALFDAEWEWGLKESPEWATHYGDTRYNHLWTDFSPEAIERRKQHTRDLVTSITAIPRGALSEDEQLNYDLFLYDAKRAAEGLRFPSELLVLDQMGGVYKDVADMAQIIPRRTLKDFENYLERLRRVPALVDQNIALMKRGADSGVTPPRDVLGKVAALMSEQIVDQPTSSPIYTTAFGDLPPDIPAPERTRLQEEAKKLIISEVLPSFKKLKANFENEYLPKARASIALSDMPDGKAWYAYNVRRSTTTDMTPDEIHELGLSEVKRLREAMEAVMRETGFNGSLKDFFNFLRTDPKFYYTTTDDLLIGYRDICKRIDPELSKLFGTLPRLTYGVRPVPDYSAKTQTTAYYMPGSYEAGRAGYFYANTYNLPARPKWEMEALTLHEAVPGHHLQISRAMELGELPKFRQFAGYTAYVEGWGLYAEALGYELGMYKDPYMKFGQLTYEMWRSIRLVVDTGMHAKGWSRERAVQFFEENSGRAKHDIEVEVNRYIVWPAQALAYKIGQLKILELRKRAEAELGDKFSIRDFHDQLLGAGAMPLPVLESRINRMDKQYAKQLAQRPPESVSVSESESLLGCSVFQQPHPYRLAEAQHSVAMRIRLCASAHSDAYSHFSFRPSNSVAACAGRGLAK